MLTLTLFQEAFFQEARHFFALLLLFGVAVFCFVCDHACIHGFLFYFWAAITIALKRLTKKLRHVSVAKGCIRIYCSKATMEQEASSNESSSDSP